jgi:hypothetical protein
MTAKDGADMRDVGVRYVLLYRTSRDWRITVGEIPDAMACGSLPKTPATEPFEVAAREFEAILRAQYALDSPVKWEQMRPDWWGADISGEPGAARESAGD